MPGKAVGRVAVELPWLCPNTDSLIALADAPATVPGMSAADPALSAFLFRFAQLTPEPAPFDFAPGALLSALLPETALALLAAVRGGTLPTNSLAHARTRAVADRAAQIASRLAEATRLVPADAVAAVARLAPLGWYAVSAVDPFAAAEPLADPDFPTQAAEIQARAWGLDHASITRRLAARWRLPSWVATTIGCLTLPLRVAGHLASHRDVFAVVQLAVLLAEAEGTDLGLTRGASRAELLDHLHLTEQAVEAATTPCDEQRQVTASSGFPADPHQVALLPNLLRHAGQSRRRNGPSLVARLEDQIDQLHRVAADLGDHAGDRLREAKLDALAELAAGAGHEINNPLAVISGTAQRLLRTEPDPDRSESLRTVVRQTQRIAGILRDLMQFARPSKPEPGSVAVADLFRGVCEDLTPLAVERGVRLELDSPGVEVEGDPKQLRHALCAVTRNAVEAAPARGWVRVTAAADETGVTIAVEDSGPGLTPEAATHAFDPFFSGRSAGRGRGLGLPTAWKLLRQNGGDLRHDTPKDGPTRFTLTVRRAYPQEMPARRSA